MRKGIELEERARLVLRILIHGWLRAFCFLAQKIAVHRPDVKRGACAFGAAHSDTKVVESCLLFVTKKHCFQEARCKY
jgi:hypothetical protein